jgi:hypothetical protein
MVTITRNNDDFIFEVKGMHKLWAFKSEITIPASHIISAYQDVESITGWKGWRLPGTFIPFVLTAGTFYNGHEKDFWDSTDLNKCIIVELKDEQYDKLVIEVEDVAASLTLLLSGNASLQS